MVKQIFSYLKKKPGLVFLILLLAIINFASLKSQLYFFGWDNYSSYFNLKTNLFRTFFSTWREYRGLGVPSDAEATDLFRQLFFLILSPIIKKQLLDQLFFVLCLNVGVVGMYYFAFNFFNKFLNFKKIASLEIISFLSAFFYLFNLNTLAVFYFPMIMYINRFAFLPLLFLIMLKFSLKEKLTLKNYLLAVVVILFFSGSFITPTVLLTFIPIMIIFSLSLGNWKRQIIFYLLFIGLNLFWLLPFTNYTLQKSPIIKLAPTFIEANETQLNRSASFYSLDRLLTLYPNFFDNQFTDIATSTKHSLYPNTESLKSIAEKSIIFLFPLLYLIGSLLVFIKYKKRVFLWIPIVIFLSLFLIGKQHTLIGFSYNWLQNYIPFFAVLFRFADTKFNIFISFAGSLAAGLAILFILGFIKKQSKQIRKMSFVILFLLVLLTIYPFRLYFSGSLIGFYMYNKLPKDYFQIADTINNDNDNFRVLHLPLDKNGYWKSYVWGNLGSSFLHFMIDKPIIDRTFEPASMENAQIHQAIFALTDNAQMISNQPELDKRSQKLYQLLGKIGVKYIIWDESVSTTVYSRGLNFWGEFNSADSKKLIQNLKNQGLLIPTAQYQININNYLNTYPNNFPLDKKTTNYLQKNQQFSLQLLRLKDYQPKLYFSNRAESIDPNLNNLLNTNLGYQKQNYIQGENLKKVKVYPFKRTNANLKQDNNQLNLSLKNPFSSENLILESSPQETSRSMIEITARVENTNLLINLYQIPSPIIQNQKISQKIAEVSFPLDQNSFFSETASSKHYLSDWQSLNTNFGNFRLKLGNYIFPLPSNIKQKEKSLGYLMFDNGKLNLELLKKDQTQNYNLNQIQLTKDPNCFKDKSAGYSSSIDQNSNQVIINSKNGSTCFYGDLQQYLTSQPAHLEIKLNIQSKNNDLDKQNIPYLNNLSQYYLNQFIFNQPKPNLLNICAKHPDIDDCYNQHQILKLESQQSIIIPLEKSIKGLDSLLVLFSLKNTGFQQQQLTINSLTINTFAPLHSEEINIEPQSINTPIVINKNEKLVFSVPKTFSLFSQKYQPATDGFSLSNQPCQEKNCFRTYRLINNYFLSYFENSYNLMEIKNNFQSNNFLLWAVDYHLFSGKYPKFILDDGFYHYKDQYFSQDQGYPDVFKNKPLQNPEFFFTGLNKNYFSKEFSDPYFAATYTYIPSQPELSDRKPKNFTIHQDSENQGLLALNSFIINELPADWQNLAIKTPDSNYNYSLPKNFTYQQILPSLWKINIQKNSSNQPILLAFNESYDKQWNLYSNLLKVIFGGKTNYPHYKLNGFANAWEIDSDKTEETIYLFYFPERLSFIGWIATLLAIFILAKLLVKKPVRK